MVVRYLTRFLQPPARRVTICVLIVALLVAAICWYFGADVWHSILLGSVITTVGVIGLVGATIDVADVSWRGGRRTNRNGSRSDVAELSWSLRGSHGRVGNSAMWRVQQLARRRLALHQLDLHDPADSRRIKQLIGRSAYTVLGRGDRRPPRLRSLLGCLDALEALDPTRTAAPLPRSRRRTPIFSPDRPKRRREL
ncbi:MAG: hypothetical protein ACRDZR_01270 [Acidimicrobiales bacterium]